jgi:hypothetical protein
MEEEKVETNAQSLSIFWSKFNKELGDIRNSLLELKEYNDTFNGVILELKSRLSLLQKCILINIF